MSALPPMSSTPTVPGGWRGSPERWSEPSGITRSRRSSPGGSDKLGSRSRQSKGARAMQFGASIFFTDYSITPAALAVAMEERGFDSLWAAEHSHIPVPRRTPAPGGGELPKRYYDV